MDKKWVVSARQRCDLEMLLVGGFSPLSGFLSQANYERVLSDGRLVTGELWPIPITLDVSDAFAEQVIIGEDILLCDEDQSLLATMKISDKWRPEKRDEVRSVFGTEDPAHPGVSYTLDKAGSWYLGGPLTTLHKISHDDFIDLRHTPQFLKDQFLKSGYQKVVGFQTRNPIHRAHLELTLRAAREIDAHILLHPVVGLTMPGDIDYFTRVRCYKKIIPYYPKGAVTLSLLPLAMRMAGPKEALWHALIRKNYGCTHFIIGRDHAGPGKNSFGINFYQEYAAQELVMAHQKEIGIGIVPFAEMVYVKERRDYASLHEIKSHETALTISGTALRQHLSMQRPIPSWFSFPEIIDELSLAYPPKHKQGFTVFFTGLSGAGKSTLAHALKSRFMSLGKRNITILDGDIIRKILTTELGFSKTDRELNIRRIGYVAAEVTKVGGVAICAVIAPYREIREENRQLIRAYGGYIEVYVSTSLAVCESRDTKGFYFKARHGQIKNFTGIHDPYEPPENPDIILDTAKMSIEMAVQQIVNHLIHHGYLLPDHDMGYRDQLVDNRSLELSTEHD